MNADQMKLQGYTDRQIAMVLGQTSIPNPTDLVSKIIEDNLIREQEAVNFVGVNRILRAACHSAEAARELILKKRLAREAMLNIEDMKTNVNKSANLR